MTTIAEPTDGFTVKDWEALPEDGRRWELIEGALVVSPYALFSHSAASNRLARVLMSTAPEHFEAFTEADVILNRHNVFVPDVVVIDHRVVAPLKHLDSDHVVLAAEVESPSSRRRDRLLKPEIYARAGIAHFWRVERDGGTLTIIAHDLVHGTYIEVARATGEQLLTVRMPYEISLRPNDLTRR